VKLKIRVAPQRTTVRFQSHCLFSAVDFFFESTSLTATLAVRFFSGAARAKSLLRTLTEASTIVIIPAKTNPDLPFPEAWRDHESCKIGSYAR
jgi:hypothetical protein